MVINNKLSPGNLQTQIQKIWELSGKKILAIENSIVHSSGTPVYTVKGKYTSRGWTEWTQGFIYGSAILQFEATGDKNFLESGRENTIAKMSPHVSHFGVHDHGFNNISTYGNLLRLMLEGRIEFNQWEKYFYELAIKISGAIQAKRWTKIKDGGFVYSFNGPHSLFVDTIRSCRIIGLSHSLGHYLQEESDLKVNLLGRMIQHLSATANYSVFYGEGRDIYDVRGRTAHECLFNTIDGNFRCTSTQQGYSGFSTWTRGLAWAILGFSEQLEFIETIDEAEFSSFGGKEMLKAQLLKAGKAVSDFYIANSPTDGIPYWDTAAPDLPMLGDYLNKPADPFNDYEPVDSSAAAIAAQGLLRLGRYLSTNNEPVPGKMYFQAGLTISGFLFSEPYLSTGPDHQGLILHSVYHRPNGWDYIPEGKKIPSGESSMWGDYHARELAIYLQKLINSENYYTFFNCLELKKLKKH